jgi:protein-S-isoprenylcysteine O-methyltransferase Ste14
MRRYLPLIDLPPVWLAAHLALAYGLSLVPLRFFGGAGQWLGAALVMTGVALMLAAVVEMTLARTTVIPRRNPASLVTTGIFRVSRNPIYLGDALVLTGAILWWDAGLALPLVAVFVWLIRTRFILDEEARLTTAFGPEFDLWSQRVRRWIGWRKGGVR